MPGTRRRFLAAVGASIAVAGCQDDGGGQEPTDTPTGESTESAAPGQSADVQVSDHDELGEILVDGDGMTLYVFDTDEQGAGESSCTGGCLDNWPVFSAEEPTAGEGVEAEFSTFEHGETGDVQVAANGWPLYYFTPDEEPGDANGQGVNEVWWVIGPTGEPIRSSTAGSGSDDGADSDAGPY